MDRKAELQPSEILQVQVSRRGLLKWTVGTLATAAVSQLVDESSAEAQGPDCQTGINFTNKNKIVPSNGTNRIRVIDGQTQQTVVGEYKLQGGEGQLTYSVTHNSIKEERNSFRARIINLDNPLVNVPIESNCGFRADVDARSIQVQATPTVVPPTPRPVPTIIMNPRTEISGTVPVGVGNPYTRPVEVRNQRDYIDPWTNWDRAFFWAIPVSILGAGAAIAGAILYCCRRHTTPASITPDQGKKPADSQSKDSQPNGQPKSNTTSADQQPKKS